MKWLPSVLISVSALFTGTVLCAQNAQFDSTGLIAGNDAVRLVSRQFEFTEGPAVDSAGNIFFTDQPNDRIWEYSTDEKLTLYISAGRRSNGLYFDRQGHLVSAADQVNELFWIGSDKSFHFLMPSYRGHRLNGPNDLWINAGGDIWFTDPYYKRLWWNGLHPKAAREWTYYLAKGSSKPVMVDSTLVKPNGIVGTPDGRYLFIADLEANKTYRFRIGTDGRLSEKMLFVPQGSDGMTLDEKGNLYLAGKGITVYDASAKKIAFIPVPEEWTANLCFGGKEKKTLFITASQGVYILPMTVRGVE